MGWLFDNPIAQMWGPYFLGFYAIVFAVLLGFGWWHRGRVDESAELADLPIPSKLDPYQLAYLRGGISEVLRLATVDLYQRGQLTEVKSGWFSAKRLRLIPTADTANLDPPLRRVAEFYRTPRKPTELLQSGITVELEDSTAQWDRWIESERLRHSADAKTAHGAFQMVMLAVLVSLALYKLAAALMAGRENIWFLVVGMIIGSIALLATTQLPRFTRRGRRFIENLQTAYARLKRPSWGLSASSETSKSGLATDHAVPVLAMGLFGVAALQGGPLDTMYQHYAQSAGLGSSCGGDCGGGDGGGGGGGCGGGCGGCGGCGG